MSRSALVNVSSDLKALRRQISVLRQFCSDWEAKLQRLERCVASLAEPEAEGDAQVQDVSSARADAMRSVIVSALDAADRRGCSRTQLRNAINWEYETNVSGCQLDELLAPMISQGYVRWKPNGQYNSYPVLRYWLEPCAPNGSRSQPQSKSL